MIRIAAAFLLFATLVGCSRTEDIRVANVPQDWFNAPLTLAISGWPDGSRPANVSTFSLPSGLASKTAVMAGNAEIGLASPVVLLRDPAAAGKIKILGCYMRSGHVVGIATRTGKVEAPIGYVAGTISEVFLASYMLKEGRAEDYFSGKIRKVPLTPPNTASAISGPAGAAGSVNSVVTWESHLSAAAAETDKPVIRDPSLYVVNVCLIANRAAYRDRQAAINSFAAQVAKASGLIMAKPDESRAEVEKATKKPAGALRAIWGQVDFRWVADQASLRNAIRTEAEALQRTNMIQTAPPDPTSYL